MATILLISLKFGRSLSKKRLNSLPVFFRVIYVTILYSTNRFFTLLLRVFNFSFILHQN